MSDLVIRDMAGNEIKRFSELENLTHNATIGPKVIFRDIENGHADILDEIFNKSDLSVNEQSLEDYNDDKRDDVLIEDANCVPVYVVKLDTSTTSGVKVTIGTVPSTTPTLTASQLAAHLGQTGVVPVPSSSNLPVGDPEKFTGELEEMDLSELQGKVYGVAINSGAQDGTKFICSSLCAPLDFYEMLETVGQCWEKEQIHAKVFTLKKQFGERMKYLDACTVDYIEARYMDIIADGLLSGALMENVEYTCRAGFFEEEPKKEEDA